MNKIFQIARWEYLRRIKSKAFLFTLFLPFIIFIIAGIPQYLAETSEQPERMIAVLCNDNDFLRQLDKSVQDYFDNSPSPYTFKQIIKPDSSDILVKELIIAGAFDAALVVPDSFYQNNEITFYTSDYGIEETGKLHRILNSVLLEHRLKQLGIDPEKANYLKQKVNLTEFTVSEEG
ncbi:MAG: ABC transporter permease, partial [Candidatus Marinimicrobia bacterium]|nr:ABC transporter permease [Candidatus Neomarinimicrobiota bacterium]